MYSPNYVYIHVHRNVSGAAACEMYPVCVLVSVSVCSHPGSGEGAAQGSVLSVGGVQSGE